MRKFTDKELELAPKVAVVMGIPVPEKMVFGFQDRALEYDCLEWLRERCKDHVILSHDVGDEDIWWVWFDEYKPTQAYASGDSILETLYRVIIEIGGQDA